MKSHKTIRSTYMDNNNIYQGLIKSPKKTILIIKTMIPSKDNQSVIDQQPDPSPNVMKTSDILLIPGDEEMAQYIIPINKSGPQDIFALW